MQKLTTYLTLFHFNRRGRPVCLPNDIMPICPGGHTGPPLRANGVLKNNMLNERTVHKTTKKHLFALNFFNIYLYLSQHKQIVNHSLKS